jgi:hypothetical protein
MLTEGDFAQLTPLFGRRVQVQGRAVYRPSGRLLRVDVETFEDMSLGA